MSKQWVLAAVLAASTFLYALAAGAPSVDAQTATATPASTVGTGGCTASNVWNNPPGNVTFNASPQVVQWVCVQLSGSNSGQIGNGSVLNGCYTVSGVGTTTASVTRTDPAASCQATNIYAQYVQATPTATGTATGTATQTATATATQTATATATTTGTVTATATMTATGTATSTGTATATGTGTQVPAPAKTGTGGPPNPGAPITMMLGLAALAVVVSIAGRAIARRPRR